MARPEFRATLQHVAEQHASPDAVKQLGPDLDRLAATATSADGLLAMLRNPDAPLRLRSVACWLLARMRKAGAVPVLRSLFADEGFDLRAEAAKALGVARDKQAIAPLEAAFPTADVPLRIAILDALRDIGGRRAFAFLRRALVEDVAPDVRSAAAQGLGFFGAARALQPLVRVLLDGGETPAVRGAAAEGLATLGDRRAVAPLLEVLSDPSPEVRFWAVFALGEVAGEEVLPILERIAAIDTSRVPGWWSVAEEATSAAESIRDRLHETS